MGRSTIQYIYNVRLRSLHSYRDHPQALILSGLNYLFGTRTAEHKGCNWACKLTDGCSLKSCVLANATEMKVNTTACSTSMTGLRVVSNLQTPTAHYIIQVCGRSLEVRD